VTPLKIELPRGPKPRHITLRAAGYIDYSIDVVPDANNRVEVTLVPVPKREHPHASSSAHRASRPAAQPKPAAPVQKPAPDVAGGDLVTPFSH
jgi:hypothetical protein